MGVGQRTERAAGSKGELVMNEMPVVTPHSAVEAFRRNMKGQVVLVLQGGGALGAYQVGVYQALYEAGVDMYHWALIARGFIQRRHCARRLRG